MEKKRPSLSFGVLTIFLVCSLIYILFFWIAELKVINEKEIRINEVSLEINNNINDIYFESISKAQRIEEYVIADNENTLNVILERLNDVNKILDLKNEKIFILYENHYFDSEGIINDELSNINDDFFIYDDYYAFKTDIIIYAIKINKFKEIFKNMDLRYDYNLYIIDQIGNVIYNHFSQNLLFDCNNIFNALKETSFTDVEIVKNDIRAGNKGIKSGNLFDCDYHLIYSRSDDYN